jgi:hypothetical protein
MPSWTSLDIRGPGDRPVPNTFVRQEDETRHLGMLFPGYGYRATMPLLYYPERLLVARGADVLRVEYAYDRQPEFRRMDQAQRDRWFYGDVRAVCDAGLAQRLYERVTLVGKSIGTQAIGHLLEVEERLSRAEYVWLTPLLRDLLLRAQIERGRPHSLFVIGTADPHYSLSALSEAEDATGGQSVVVEGADHSLEIGGDILRSLHAMEQVMGALERFLYR